MPKLKSSERLEIERRLHNPDFQLCLQRVQNIVRYEFEKLKDQADSLLIRTVIPRDEIKQLDRILEKIEEGKQENPSYSLVDVNDLIGIKVVCPYLTDVEQVIDWVRNFSGFKVLEDNKKEEPSGYRGWHFTVELEVKGPLLLNNQNLIGLKCEIQVKTMLEESWDAKTHEVIYRREQRIHPALLRGMQNLSKHLHVLDEESKNVKELIQEREQEELKRKTAVARLYLLEATELFEKVLSRIEKGVDTDTEGLEKKEFTKNNVLRFIPPIHEYREKHGISKDLCYLAGLVALYAKKRHVHTWALNLCEELLRQETTPTTPANYLAVACIYWALHRFDEALEYTKKALQLAQKYNDDQRIINALSCFAYWVAEKVWFQERVNRRLVNQARDYIEQAVQKDSNNFPVLDSKGFLLITIGSTRQGINEGLDLCRRTYEKMVGTDSGELADAFFLRHETIAMKRIAELAAEDI